MLAPRALVLPILLALGLGGSVSAALSPTAVPVPLPLPCDLSQSSNSRHLATDAGGGLWLIAHCTGQVVVVRSLDGGATWGAPATIWPSGVVQASIEGGTLPGHAIAGWETFTGQLLVSVTADGGATWSVPATIIPALSTTTDGMSLVAEGDWYHVMTWSAFRNRALVRSSGDRGSSWGPEVELAMPWAFGDLVHDPVSGQLELVSDSPAFFRRTSADHGASFSPAAPMPGGCCLTSSDWAIGGLRQLVGVGGGPELWRFDLGAATGVAIPGLPLTDATQRAVDADSAGTAFTVGTESGSGRISMHRVPAGAIDAGPALVLDDLGDFPAIVACEEGSAAMAWRSADGTVYFDKSCADGGWDCCVADVVNEPPSCAAGGPHVAECAGAFTRILLDGRGSVDPEGAVLSHAWTSDCPGATFDDPSSAEPSLFLDGTAGCAIACSVTLTVSDGAASASCSAPVAILDSTAPSVAASGGAAIVLWPPNHRMVEIAAASLAPVVSDACAVAPGWRLIGCVSDQPDDATGDGSTEGDCAVSPAGDSLRARAERDGARPEGRTYTVLAEAFDACGNVSAPAAVGRVHVPRDQGGGR